MSDGISHVLGIGAGPANLSLAALADPCDDVMVTLLESRKIPSWHPGLLWGGSRLQVSPVKDLVSLVDPTSRYSFLNFLHEEGRLYRHLIAGSAYISRMEFDQYFRWAAKKLPVHLDSTVQSVDHDGQSFVVRTDATTWRTKNLVLGIGQSPRMPPCAGNVRSDLMWHSSDHLRHNRPMGGKNVLLVGGGQSAAEIALDVLSGRTGLPRQFTWASGREGFVPMDDSPFTNDWFNPSYVEHFHGLPGQRRSELLNRQMPAHGGIDTALLDQLYRRLYEIDYLLPEGVDHKLMAGSRLTWLEKNSSGFAAVLDNPDTCEKRVAQPDYVILATGYRPVIPEFMGPLGDRLELADGSYQLGMDYRVEWHGPPGHRIYAQNAAQATHGVADPNLSLIAWRSAVILNSIAEREIYALKEADITISLNR
ncbi:lysine N(6)-hydroxylase/L-ornithine N(5)-oxygenase family protein [Streptomyces hokutonensis]|uniref:L-lysine N6-monooxygenase MbtG n=1 Tax=Streptomyces hokutonensis TaxID=1306990 RepID=A0ABW6ML68_9ACTN